MKHTYSAHNVEIESLQIDQSHLNTKRMLDLMAVSNDDGPAPLYLHTVSRVLREMRIIQQDTNAGFNYNEFKKQLLDTNMTAAQLGPLNQRLDTLESFMPRPQTSFAQVKDKKGKRRASAATGNDWTPQVCDLLLHKNL